MPTPHLHRQVPPPPQIRRQPPRPHTPNLDPITLQLMIPIQHQHIQRRLTTSVSNSFEIDLFRPAGGEGRGGEVGFCGFGLVGETGDEDEAGGGGEEEERGEGVG